MAIRIKAVEREMKIGTYAGTYRYMMQPELYSTLTQDKVIKEAALRSGVSQGVMQACWDAAGEVIKAWATEGHSVALPGLGTMRFGLRARTVADVSEVGSDLIKSRRIVFTPNTDLKSELKNTAVQITCYDRNGNLVQRVTTKTGDVETESDVDTTEDDDTSNSGSDSTASSTSDSGSGSTGDSGSTGGNSGSTGGNSGGEEDVDE